MAAAVVLTTACLTAPSALGQNEVLNELYGSGVHAYNSGSFRRAYDDLTMAVRSGSRDPRVYYYRGLSYLRLGRPQEAGADFKKAAALEMADNDHFYPVSKSLERIQGVPRLQIEKARASARLVAYQTRERGWYERYHRIRKNEPNVLAPPDGAEKLPPPRKPAPPPKKPADDGLQPEPPEDEMPAEKEGDDAEDKAPTDDMPEEKPKQDNPFGDEPAEEMPEEKPTEDAPFGDDADAKEPADDMPAEKEGDDADANEPADEMPAEKEGDDADAEKEGGEAGANEPANEMPDEKEGDEKNADDKDEGEMPADEKKADEKKPADDNPFNN